MAKIIELKDKKQEGINSFLDNLQKAVNEYEIDNIIAISKDKKTQEILIGISNVNINEEIELISHLQIDVMNRVIKENYITP